MMKRSDLKIERAIEEILALGKSSSESAVSRKRRRGRPEMLANIPVWDLGTGAPSSGRTVALISMCIKEDMEQSIDELAARVAKYKSRSFSECLEILQKLSGSGMLGYYDHDAKNLKFKRWEPGKEKDNDGDATD